VADFLLDKDPLRAITLSADELALYEKIYAGAASRRRANLVIPQQAQPATLIGAPAARLRARHQRGVPGAAAEGYARFFPYQRRRC
jgi:hypothetical protein